MDDNAVAVDGLAVDWDWEVLFAFPLTAILLKSNTVKVS
jgi:hypothetical protein